MELAPLLPTKLAHATVGLTATFVGYGLWADGFAPELVARALAVAFVGVGLVIAVRSLRIGVVCESAVVRVRGLLLTRVVPRGSIEALTDFPALRWRDRRGRRRWSPIVFLGGSPGSFGRYRRHNAAELDRLRRGIVRFS